MRIVPIVAALLFLFAVACDKKSKAPRVDEAPTSQPTSKKADFKVSAPKEIPAAFKTIIETNWPLVEKAGGSFDEDFKLAAAAKRAGDRGAMSDAVNSASKNLQVLQDRWAEVSYWPINNLENDEKLQEKCLRFISKYERKVKKWVKKAKGLKEFSQVR